MIFATYAADDFWKHNVNYLIFSGRRRRFQFIVLFQYQLITSFIICSFIPFQQGLYTDGFAVWAITSVSTGIVPVKF